MRAFILTLCTFMVASIGLAQDQSVKIVFDVTSADEKVHQSTMRHIKAMSQAYPNSEFEVVMYSGSINMVLRAKSTVAVDMESLAQKDNVKFVICEGTMKRHGIDKSALIPGVSTVPDGILEIINKQKEGWGYIKEGQ